MSHPILAQFQTLKYSRDQLVIRGCRITLVRGRTGEEVDFGVTKSVELKSTESDDHRLTSESINTASIADSRTELESIRQALDTIFSFGHRVVPALEGKVIRLEKRISELEQLLLGVQASLTEKMIIRAKMEAQ